MRDFFSNLLEKYLFNPLRKVPGEKTFGNYRYLPLFFLFGASLEFLMCNLYAGPQKVNFCKKSFFKCFLKNITKANFIYF
jgi:hypothetical protein